MWKTLLLQIAFTIILLAICINPIKSQTGVAKTCWQCQNGVKPSKDCEEGPKHEIKDTGKGSPPEIRMVTFNATSTIVNPCKTLTEFFTKYSLVSSEWVKRNAKGRNTGPEKVYCVAVFVWTTKYSSAPQVYRDCIRGSDTEIKFHFDSMLEINELKLPGCTEKAVGADRGTKNIKVCLCDDKDGCNNQWSGSGSKILSKNAHTAILLSILMILARYVSD